MRIKFQKPKIHSDHKTSNFQKTFFPQAQQLVDKKTLSFVLDNILTGRRPQKFYFSKIQTPVQRIFSKFSTFIRIPSFHIYNYKKIFHIPQKNFSKKYSKFFLTKSVSVTIWNFNKRFLISNFSVFTKFSGSIWFLEIFPLKISFDMKVLKKFLWNSIFSKKFYFASFFLNSNFVSDVFNIQNAIFHTNKNFSFFSQKFLKIFIYAHQKSAQNKKIFFAKFE